MIEAMEIWFYHLTDSPLERVLPSLIERSLERGWHSIIQATTAERLAVIDELLWIYADDSFLPHATAQEGDAEYQAVYLTCEPDNPNGAVVRFFIERAQVAPAIARGDGQSYKRCLLLFDGSDADQLADARAQWAVLKTAGHNLAYYQQGEDGRWQQKA
jgi:DNA polymerase III subunit chi